MSRFDVVIFGASGYTGKYVVEHLAHIYEEENIKWCVAGRSERKLDETLKMVSEWTGKDLSGVSKIIVNVDDEDSIDKMCKQAKVVINCVGPYRLWGEQVVKSAIKNGCDHLDISGEPIYLEGVQVRHDEAAKAKGCFVVGAAGGDSIPSEMGIAYLTDNCDTDINGISTFLKFKGAGGKANYGTWHSAVRGLADSKMLGPIRKELFKEKMPRPNHKLVRKTVFFNSDKAVNSYAVVLPATDRSVAKRTQYYNYVHDGKRPIQVETYFCCQNLPMLIGIFLFGAVFAIMQTFGEWGRSMMLKYPGIFSLGIFAKEGAPREEVIKRRFELVLEGDAYNSRIEDPNQQHDDKPVKKVRAKVSGPDFGYVGCSIFIGQCAMVLLKEREKLPGPGGIFTPGACFAKSSLIERLKKHGVKFEMLD